MKKLTLLSVSLLTLIFTSCGISPQQGAVNPSVVPSATNADATEKNISSIYVYHCSSSSVPFEEYKIDLHNKEFTILIREGFTDRTDEVKSDSPVIKVLSDNAMEEFIDAAMENGFCDWENEYDNLNIDDGHQWGITLDFSDGTKKEMTGSNAYPDTWNEMLTAFVNLTGENVLFTEANWLDNESSSDNEDIPPPTKNPTIDDSISIDTPYASILNAYAKLEESGYAFFDEETIGYSFLTIKKGRKDYFGRKKPTILYSFYDINDDGSPELLIGAKNKNNINEIMGIYTLKNGKAISVIQKNDDYFDKYDIDNYYFDDYYLSLLKDNSDNCVIHQYNHDEEYQTFDVFHTIDKNAELLTLDELVYEKEWDHGAYAITLYKIDEECKEDMESVYYTEDGKDFLGDEEFCGLMLQYGAYDLSENKFEPQRINLTWKPILAKR